jgi:23S rRNA-intervening sequence protein
LLQQVNTFPRAYRFVLGDRIASTALDILEGLVEASHRRDKRAVLDTVNLKLERLRYLIRMSKDLQLLSLYKYEYVAREMNEVGAMLGGWLKQQRSREP